MAYSPQQRVWRITYAKFIAAAAASGTCCHLKYCHIDRFPNKKMKFTRGLYDQLCVV